MGSPTMGASLERFCDTSHNVFRPEGGSRAATGVPHSDYRVDAFILRRRRAACRGALPAAGPDPAPTSDPLILLLRNAEPEGGPRLVVVAAVVAAVPAPSEGESV